MSTTSEAADVDGSGQPATSNSTMVSNSSSPEMERWCSECDPKLTPGVVFCLSCKQPLCAACDKEVVHTSKATRSHPWMEIQEYLLVKRGLGHSSLTDDQMDADDENKFCFYSPLDHHIHLQPRLASLVADPDARPSLAAFIGPTGVGKSSLLRLLVSLDGERAASHMPLVGAANDAQSTSADIHMYAGGQVPTHSQAQSVVQDSHTQAQSAIDDSHTQSQAAVEDSHTQAQSAIDDSHTQSQAAVEDSHTQAQSAVEDSHTQAQAAVEDSHSQEESAIADSHTQAQSAVEDSHSQAESTVDDSTYPLLYADSEGRDGSMEPRAIQSMWKLFHKYFEARLGKYEDFQKMRFDHVQVSYPRMLYIFVDVLCFVFQGNWREQKSILDPLLDWGKAAAIGAANQHRPQLILIFNKTGAEAADQEFDDFRKTYKKWMQGDKSRSHNELQLYYSDPLVCLIPQMAIDATVVLRRVKMLRQVIHECTQRIRRSREEANQLFTRRQLQLHMQLAADTFSKDPNAEFDIYKASMARRPPSGKLSDYIVDFRRAVEQANSKCTRKSERYQISLNVVKMRIKLSVPLWIGRLNENVPVGANAKLPEDLRNALEQAQTVIDGEEPCAARKGSGSLLCHCDTLRHMHASAPHASVQSGKAVRWDGDFIAYPGVQETIKGCRLVDLAGSALCSAKKLDVKEIRTQLSKVRESERNKYPWLESFTFYRVCVSCMVELPTEVLSCGHIICAMCAKEVADSSLPKMDIDLTCPVCLSSAKWYPKDLPRLAGYRILSLDGGGVRGIVELLSLEKIMSFFPDMHVKDLFDIIVGTSTGGIIALALTVHALNEQPKSLPKVIELFQKFCREVFSSKMLRVGAGNAISLRLCQFLRIYDTKYKNDNLLKLLKENLGEQPLLSSCVGGPHVIITSCDRDNNLASAYFTSYNRKILENECHDLSGQAVREETEQPTRKPVFGRVPNNHLFSAKEAAAATSAAGTYFPSYEAGNQWWIDGGLQFNCPAKIAIQEARTMSRKHRTITLISLGCGRLEYEKKPQRSESLISFLKLVVDVVTDSEMKSREAMELLEQLQPDSSGCSIRLNPTIKVPQGRNCELDDAKEIRFLMEATKTYLDNDGLASVHQAANLVFAALFYLDDGIDQDSRGTELDRLSIRSRAALPELLQDALMTASRSSSPPFSVTVRNVPGVKSKFRWDECTWDKNAARNAVMNLPFELDGLPMLRPLVVEVKLHMCLPGTNAPKEWPLGISGMPCKLGAADQ